MKNVIYLSGLPRSGSTLLANILAMHPEIQSTPSSPLCGILQSMRAYLSNDPFFKAQLDTNFEGMQRKVARSMWSTIQAWSEDGEKDIVIDKNRGWLFNIEWMRELIPNFKMIVTLRDLRDIYASIEKQHRKTLFINFADGMEHNIVDVRASALFADNGVIGSCLKAIKNIGDIPNIIGHLLIWRYEDLISNPEKTINQTFDFLGVKNIPIDFNNIVQSTYESDSHYNMKYPHSIKNKIEPAAGFNESLISPRITQEILGKCKWYYDYYYPDLISSTNNNNNLGSLGSRNPNELNDLPVISDDALIRQIENAIKDEIS